MIQKFVDRFLEKKDAVRAKLAEKHPEDYKELVSLVVGTIGSAGEKDYGSNPDPERVTQVDDGDYQGTLLFTIGDDSYQPSKYWAIKIAYGSCSGCDTLMGINELGGDDDTPNPQQVDDYYTLCLHVVQGLKEIEAERV